MLSLLHDNGKSIEVSIDRTIKEKVLDKAHRVVHTMNNSFVGIVDGKSGVGKTTLAIQFAKVLDPNFNLNKMAWIPSKFLDLINNAKKGDCIMFDEGMIINSRSAISRVNRAIIIALSQIRSRNIFILVNINSIFDLDKNIALHRADVLFHLYTKDDKVDGEKRIKIYGRQKMKFLYLKGRKYYNYSSSPNFFAKPSRKYIFLVDEGEYERRKRKDTIENTEFAEGNLGRREAVYRLAFIKLVNFLKKEKDMNHLQVSKITNIDSPRISKIITWAKDKKYIEDDREEIDTKII